MPLTSLTHIALSHTNYTPLTPPRVCALQLWESGAGVSLEVCLGGVSALLTSHFLLMPGFAVHSFI